MLTQRKYVFMVWISVLLLSNEAFSENRFANGRSVLIFTSASAAFLALGALMGNPKASTWERAVQVTSVMGSVGAFYSTILSVLDWTEI